VILETPTSIAPFKPDVAPRPPLPGKYSALLTSYLDTRLTISQRKVLAAVFASLKNDCRVNLLGNFGDFHLLHLLQVQDIKISTRTASVAVCWQPELDEIAQSPLRADEIEGKVW